MQEITAIDKLDIMQSSMSFVLPFGYDRKRKNDIIETLLENDFTYFKIDQPSDTHHYYGMDITVEGKELEQYFLPYVGQKLFPDTPTQQGFHRFSISIMKPFRLQIRKSLLPFTIQSVDITLAPFGIAFMTIRVELDGHVHELTDVLDFMHHFRTVEPILKEEKGATVHFPDSGEQLSVHDLLFDVLCPFLKRYFREEEHLNGYFGSLPYFEDERMYASAYLISREGALITDNHLYRMGALDGRSPDGEAFVSAHNPAYIRRVLDHTLHDRWAPYTYTVITEHAYITVTNRPPDEMDRELSQFMGTHYYNFLLHYFYKIMLLRLAFEYSQLNWKQDNEYVKSLIKLITLFSSWYYFQEVSTRSEGKELSIMFRQSFSIDQLFDDVNNTLHELYKNQESINSDRMNMLLFALTVFTVISGIYGMNLVIKDWESSAGWKALQQYNFYEWIALVTALSGIGLSIYLIGSTIGKIVIKKLRNRKAESRL
ncbi:hypothetical protein MHZ95_02860 [Sporosarcina sp. ACRSM]|uniref:hypothetical protein n=1 Tax=Sporosarcina sp. ACRSM TaxID=2918216 RepID=UPI001EF43701|nr:hypothetical protein [Sporosarcina sp. ACRSM]MCG7334217.1 hypothetical protein [Sporosarcina sp. ACRSM]